MKLKKEEDKDHKTLVKEYKRLEIFITIFMAIALCLGTFYFNVICFGTECENKSPAPLVIIKTGKTSDDVDKVDDVDTKEVSVTDLKEIFKVVYAVRTSPNAFCGSKSQTSTKISPNGGLYDVATQYDSYSEMISDLTKYATEKVLNLNENEYLEEEGKLYCASRGKGSMCGPTDYIMETTKKDKNEVVANVTVKKACGNFEEEYTYDEEFTVKYIRNNDNWIISEYTQTKSELDYYNN